MMLNRLCHWLIDEFEGDKYFFKCLIEIMQTNCIGLDEAYAQEIQIYKHHREAELLSTWRARVLIINYR